MSEKVGTIAFDMEDAKWILGYFDDTLAKYQAAGTVHLAPIPQEVEAFARLREAIAKKGAR